LSEDQNFSKIFTVGIHTITLTVTDNDYVADSDTVIVTVTESGDDNNASAGGGCTYNPRNSGMDVMMLLMIVLAFLYPFKQLREWTAQERR